MIQNILPVVADELNDYLKSTFNSVEDKVIISNIINQDGSVAVEGNNKVVITLINVTEESTLRANANNKLINTSFLEFAPPVTVNLTLLFSAFFSSKNYLEALRFISGVIYFFQSKPLFTNQNTPNLIGDTDKIHFDILSMQQQELMNIFSMMGAKYMPSVVYKMKMLTFSQDNIISEIPAVRGLGLDNRP
ncbi:MAG: DUF4255 domain-containing protein [Bacteroidota bacterium]